MRERLFILNINKVFYLILLKKKLE